MTQVMITGISEKNISAVIESDEIFEECNIGKRFLLKSCTKATIMQFRLYHPLILEWFRSGLYPYNDIHDWWSLRQLCKQRHGSGFDGYTYVNDKYEMVDCASTEEIPDYVVMDFYNGNKKRIKGTLKSITKYNIQEMRILIDNVIRGMEQTGVNTTRYNKIKERIDWVV